VQNSRVCKVKDIVEAKSIWVQYIVGQGVAYEHAIPLKTAVAAPSLLDMYFEMTRQSFVVVKG
jgi:hypothetical protein